MLTRHYSKFWGCGRGHLEPVLVLCRQVITHEVSATKRKNLSAMAIQSKQMIHHPSWDLEENRSGKVARKNPENPACEAGNEKECHVFIHPKPIQGKGEIGWNWRGWESHEGIKQGSLWPVLGSEEIIPRCKSLLFAVEWRILPCCHHPTSWEKRKAHRRESGLNWKIKSCYNQKADFSSYFFMLHEIL